MTSFKNLLSDECLMLFESCRRFAEREIAPHCQDWEDAGTFPRELYERAAKAGILGIGFAEDLGGSGGGPLEVVMQFEGLMHGGSTGVVASLIGSQGISLPILIRSGDRCLIDTVVRPVLAGEKISALAVTEPGTGSDVAGVKTRATRQGDDYIINGSKMFITSGVRADFLVTLVRTGEDPHQGLSFVVIEKNRPGVVTSRPLKKTGWWASDTAEIVFDNVKIPARYLVGKAGSGFGMVIQNFQMERMGLTACGLATAKIALAMSIKYAKERHAFGRSLSGFQVTRHKLADMATRVFAAEALTYQVAQSMTREDCTFKEIAMAKNFVAETAISVCYDAVQIHGGAGYMRETLVERLSRDARLLSIGGGTQEIMKEIISKELSQ